MRLLLKQNILKTLDLMEELQKIISQQWMNKNREQLFEWLAQLQEAAIEIGNAVEAESEPDKTLIGFLEEYCELVYWSNQAVGDEGQADVRMTACVRKEKEIRRYVEQTSVQIKIAFFPYKYSMWDSLESIWSAASRDSRCECQVIPIPFYDRKENMELGAFHYEGDCYPEKVHIRNYQDYHIETEKPDIVYIHNPYDEYNRVTCIDPRFFMEKLKKNGAILIYVPYYMASGCRDFKSLGTGYRTKGAICSDIIILQSDKLKTAFEYSGIDSQKLLVTGSPKIDKICQLKGEGREIKNKEWKSAIRERKTILLCSSINDLLSDDRWLYNTEVVIDTVLSDQSLALIWRPHPLLLQTIQVMKKSWLETYQKICHKVQKAENGIIDEGGDFGDALRISDGMISDFSSLVLQYTFSEKPVLLLRGSSEGRKAEVFCDYFSNYFVAEGTTIEDFILMIKERRDEKKEERMAFARASVANPDGTCGEKTHAAVIKRVCFWEKQ